MGIEKKVCSNGYTPCAAGVCVCVCVCVRVCGTSSVVLLFPSYGMNRMPPLGHEIVTAGS